MVGAYDAAAASAEKASVATERQERRYRQLAQAARESESQSRNQATINGLIGVGDGSGKSARDSAALFEAQADAMEKAERRAAQLKVVLDPVGRAQDQLNDELRENIELQRQGFLTTEQLAQAQQLARTRFDETTMAIERQNRGMSRQAVASRLNLARQGADVAVTAAMGMNPAMIAIQQGPQILDALATSGFKASAGLIAAGAAATALAGGVALLGAAWLEGEDAALAYERAVTGIGRTADLSAAELEALTVTAAEQGEVSEKAARQQATAYLATGRIGGEVIGGLIRIGKDYASVMGLDAEAATQSLARAMVEPDKAGRELTRTMGLLDQAQLRQIDSLIKSGDLLGAQKILLEALDGAVSGHAANVGQITSAWDAASRAIGGAINKFGEWLYVTETEKLAKMDSDIAKVQRGEGAGDLGVMTDRRNQLAFQIGYDNAARENAARLASRNQTAQLSEDRRAAAARGGSTRRGPDPAVEAEREAREALQRQRREEDVAAQQALAIAQARNDVDMVRRLENENALRQRTRQLIDDEVSATEAATKAEREQAELIAARGVQRDRELATIIRMNDLEVARILGNERLVASGERYLDLQDRIARYQSAGAQSLEAAVRAGFDLLAVDQARAKVMEQVNAEAEADRRLTLARLSGDDGEARRLLMEKRINDRAREIEDQSRLGPNPMNRGDGVDQAMSEIQGELDAEARGVRRAWVRDFIGDIREGGIGEALGRQFETASDRLINRLLDQLFEIDWGQMFKGGGGTGGSGDWASAIVQGAKFLFGKNANGTDFWTGGPTWVGERGPELINLPRGAQVIEHNRAMRTAFAGSERSAPNISLVINAPGADSAAADRIEAKVDAFAAALPSMLNSMVPGIVTDGYKRRVIRFE
ncbi:phage tail tape measure protein [Brevundimonas subvibrioides]|nr:phage tail length tape measure family protein [Brevundimonas subvibrioides]